MPAKDQLQFYAANPAYWQYKGKPVMLLGGSVEDNLFQQQDIEQHLDLLTACGGNYLRCTMSFRDEGDEFPYTRTERGFNLNTWNETFWERFETFLRETHRREIMVQIEIWDPWDCVQEAWDINPYNPKNNTNYTAEESGLPETVHFHPAAKENTFFETVPFARNNKVVLPYQERFVNRLFQHSLPYDHVLYCIDNETEAEAEWALYWSQYCKGLAKQNNKTIFLTEMWNAWELHHPKHNITLEQNWLFDFLDVSQNNFQQGIVHWSNFQAYKSRVRPVRPVNNVKVYGALDPDGPLASFFGSPLDGVQRFWRNIFGGMAAVRFHRPPHGLGLSDRAQTMLRGARAVTDAIDLFSCRPDNTFLAEWEQHVLSASNRQPAHESYCLTDGCSQYAVYFPNGGAATLLTASEAEHTVTWYDADYEEWLRPSNAAGGPLQLGCPSDGLWVAIVKAI